MALDLTYDDLFMAIGDYLRYGRIARASQTDAEKYNRIDSIIQQAHRSVYFHAQLPSAEGQAPQAPHEWSFMHPVATITLATNDSDYDLASDFSALSGRFTWAAGENQRPLELITEERIRALLNSDNTAGLPRYAAVRSKKPSTGVKQVFEVLVYPKPAVTYNGKVLTYRHRIEPPSLGGTVGSAPTEKPLGGAAFAQLLLAACLAQAELFKLNARGPFWTEFQEKLATAILSDQNVILVNDADSYPVDASPTGLDLRYRELAMEAAAVRQFGRDAGAWTYTQKQSVDDWVQNGYRNFLHAARGPDGRTHFWSFLRPVVTITTQTTATIGAGPFTYDIGDDETSIDTASQDGPFVEGMIGRSVTFTASGNDYEITAVPAEDELTLSGDASAETGAFTIPGCVSQILPSDFQHIVGHLVPDPGQGLSDTVPVIPEYDLRRRLSIWGTGSGPVQYACVQVQTSSGAARQGTALLFFPPTAVAYTLGMRYQIVAARLTSAAPYPLGGAEHAEALRACVRTAAAEGTPLFRDEAAKRDRLLLDAVLADRRKAHPETYGRPIGTADWNRAAPGIPEGSPGVTYNGVTII